MKIDDIEIKVNCDDSEIEKTIEKLKIIKEMGGLGLQNRLRSPVVWVTIISALLLLLGEWGLYEKLGIEQESLKHIFDFILLVLTSFGILNNPSVNNKF